MAYTSAALLSDLKVTLQLGDNYEGTSDAELYRLLTLAQQRIMRILAVHIPDVNYGVPQQMTTADSGYTYTATSDILGHAEIRGSGRGGPLLVPGSDWDNAGDVYVLEGTKTIRFPGNRARTFAGGLWIRYVAVPGDIDASTEPTLLPAEARPAIVFDAAASFAMQGGYRDPAPYERERRNILWGDPESPGDVGVIGAYKMRFTGQGVSASRSDAGYWWRSGDLR